MATDFVLEVRHATVYRGQTCVLKDLTLELAAGCHTVILGPNGAGKSTLLRLLMGEVAAAAHPETCVRLFGEERWNVWDVRRRLGFVSHELHASYLSDSRGLEVVLSGFAGSIGTYPYQQLGRAEQMRAAAVMETLGVAHLQDRPFAEASTGEQRRLLLGRALVHDPEALVLDEPTSGLDLHACALYRAGIRGLMRRARTVILVTHHVHEIPPEVSRVVFLKAGRVVADGPQAGVLTSERLSDLFELPLQLVHINGVYQAFPAATTLQAQGCEAEPLV